MSTPLLLASVLTAMGIAAACLVYWSPGIRRLEAADAGKFVALDGLRGLLASSVLVHHAYIARAYFDGKPWESPASALYRFAGDGAVAVFFMITGLLFWNKALSGRLRFGDLMRKRLRRIGPLQMFALLMISVICIARTPDGSAAPGLQNVVGMINWIGYGLLGDARINDVPTMMVDAGVTWSLSLEWCFYLLLVPMARLFTKPSRFSVAVIAAVVALFVLRRTGHHVAQGRLLQLLPFIGGMATAYVVRWRTTRLTVDTWPCGVLVLALVLCVVACYGAGNTQMLNMALVPAFVLVALGNDLFGLLGQRWLRWLGQISFSIYLLHGIVLLGTLRLLNAWHPISKLGDSAYSALVAAIGIATVLVASTTYCWIERSFFDPAATPRWLARLRRSGATRLA